HEGSLITDLIEEPPYKGKKVKVSYNKRQFYDRIICCFVAKITSYMSSGRLNLSKRITIF
ncbi:hypothetical protein J4480_01105, partial [Candidatus Woesearchaeota archaeon]|nr:hypothetical protein [Candidatus Woesearchaeota archaeon]